MILPQAILDRIDVGDCWEWLGHRQPKGYGTLGKRLAHRVVWELLVGPIPPPLQCDHLCHNKACVNPDHIRLTTNRENSLARHFYQRDKTTCPRGHPYDYFHGGRRSCLRCRQEASRRHYLRALEVPA